MHLLNIFAKQKSVWEKLFSSSELKTFYNLVNDYYRSKDIPMVIKNGLVEIIGKKERIDLRNIAQTCRQADINQWKQIIESNLQQLQMIQAQSISQFHRSFDEIYQTVTIRLWPEGTLQGVGAENLIYRKDLEGTISTVVLDLPESIQAVTPKMAMDWGISHEELFKIGFENTYIHHKPETGYIDLTGQINVNSLSNNDFLTATHILFLDKYHGFNGKYGALVGIPLRNIVLSYPINDGQFMRVIPILSQRIKNDYTKGPGSVSPYLYWYQNNKFTIINITEKGEVVLPEELRKLI